MATALPMNATAANKRTRPFYARVATLGYGLIALAGGIGIVTGLASGESLEFVSFALIFVVAGLLIAGVVWFGRAVGLILSVLLALATLAFLGPFAPFALSHPESAVEFVPIMLIVAGAGLGLVGGIVGLVQVLRRTAREQATPTERLALTTLMSILALAALVSVVMTLTGRTTVSAEVRRGAIDVQMKGLAYAPQTNRVKAGDTVRMVIKNDDPSLHTFTLPAAGIDVSIPPGSEKLIEFKAPAAGVYTFHCIPHSGNNGGVMEGMIGTLVVE